MRQRGFYHRWLLPRNQVTHKGRGQLECVSEEIGGFPPRGRDFPTRYSGKMACFLSISGNQQDKKTISIWLPAIDLGCLVVSLGILEKGTIF